MRTNRTTTDIGYTVTKSIQSPFADATYAFGRVNVEYVEYIKADWDMFSACGPWPITAGYLARLIAPSPLTEHSIMWQSVRGVGDTAVEATRDLLSHIDAALLNMPAIIADTGN